MSREVGVAQYYGKNGIRYAKILHFKKSNGDVTDKLVVNCFENDVLVNAIDCTNYSLYYAEDAAENFVLKEE